MENSIYLQTFKDKFANESKILIQSGLIFEEDDMDLFPCSKDEVLELEKTLGFFLPLAYKEFLLWGGHQSAWFLVGEDCFFKNILDNQELALELLEENKFPKELPKDAFIFTSHHGYEFDFFEVSQGDNPPIYCYSESSNESFFKLIYPSFTDYLIEILELSVKSIRSYGGSPFMKNIILSPDEEFNVFDEIK
ncbi:SMI1/KNR4 family protein [Pseudanabaena sp. UWO310]|uniref:SMI1/KNR4 family protein n=1 Tax=Pseudanabaena sp. UWO310 TaxID=2480795 RepID=UPI001680B9F0|nr:SMI1/KNR4 family protein [Pseudanabaena sp. UWO310]